MKICDKIEEYFVSLIEGEEPNEFLEHLPTCDRCHKGLTQLRRLHEELDRTLSSGLATEREHRLA
jgi:hypothetical protein